MATFAEGIGEDIATRDGLKKTEAALRGEIGALRGDLEKMEADLRADMRALEQRMTIKLGGMLVSWSLSACSPCSTDCSAPQRPPNVKCEEGEAIIASRS